MLSSRVGVGRIEVQHTGFGHHCANGEGIGSCGGRNYCGPIVYPGSRYPERFIQPFILE